MSNSDIRDLEDRVMVLFERIAAARDAQLPPQDMLFGAVAMAGDPGKQLCASASRVPMGPADRDAVLDALSAAPRLRSFSEAVDTVGAMIDFELSGD